MMKATTNQGKFTSMRAKLRGCKTIKFYRFDPQKQELTLKVVQAIGNAQIKHHWSVYQERGKQSFFFVLMVMNQEKDFRQKMKKAGGEDELIIFEIKMQLLKTQQIADGFIERGDLKMRLFSKMVQDDLINSLSNKAIFIVDSKKYHQITPKSIELIDLFCKEGRKHIIRQISGNQLIPISGKKGKEKRLKYIWVVGYEGSLDFLKEKFSQIFHVTSSINLFYRDNINDLLENIKQNSNSIEIKVDCLEDPRFKQTDLNRQFYILNFEELLFSIYAFKYITLYDQISDKIQGIEFIDFDENTQEQHKYLYLATSQSKKIELENFQNKRKQNRIQLLPCGRFESKQSLRVYQKYRMFQHHNHIDQLQKLKDPYLIPSDKIQVDLEEVKRLIEENKLCVNENIRQQVYEKKRRTSLYLESIQESINLFQKLIMKCERVSFS